MHEKFCNNASEIKMPALLGYWIFWKATHVSYLKLRVSSSTYGLNVWLQSSLQYFGTYNRMTMAWSDPTFFKNVPCMLTISFCNQWCLREKSCANTDSQYFTALYFIDLLCSLCHVTDLILQSKWFSSLKTPNSFISLSLYLPST